jgi:hypothetical protein
MVLISPFFILFLTIFAEKINKNKGSGLIGAEGAFPLKSVNIRARVV